MKKIIFGVVVGVAVIGFIITRSVQKAGLGEEVMHYMTQVGKLVRQCQETTGKSEAECKCLRRVPLDKINAELNELIADNPGLEDQTIAGDGQRHRIGDLVPEKSFAMYCK